MKEAPNNNKATRQSKKKRDPSKSAYYTWLALSLVSCAEALSHSLSRVRSLVRSLCYINTYSKYTLCLLIQGWTRLGACPEQTRIQGLIAHILIPRPWLHHYVDITPLPPLSSPLPSPLIYPRRIHRIHTTWWTDLPPFQSNPNPSSSLLS